CTEYCNRLEGHDHTDNCTQKTQQRSNHGDDFDQLQVVFDIGTLFEDGFLKFQFERLTVDTRIVFGHFQNTTQWVVWISTIGFELAADFAADTHQHKEAPNSNQDGNNTYTDNDLTNQTTLADTLLQIRQVDQR